MFERKGADGNGLRSLRNNLVFVVADETKVNEMKRAIVRRLALQELKRPERVKELADHQQAKVFELEKKSETEAAIAIQQCYRHVLYPSRNALGGAGSVQLAHSVIDIQNASERPGSGQLQVVRQLQSQNKLRDASDQPDSPSYIRDRTPLKKGQMTTRDLRDEFRRDPSLSILLSDDVFRKAIRKGIEEGVYIYKRGELLAGPATRCRRSTSMKRPRSSRWILRSRRAFGLGPRQRLLRNRLRRRSGGDDFERAASADRWERQRTSGSGFGEGPRPKVVWTRRRQPPRVFTPKAS